MGVDVAEISSNVFGESIEPPESSGASSRVEELPYLGAGLCGCPVTAEMRWAIEDAEDCDLVRIGSSGFLWVAMNRPRPIPPYRR
jgi:hypothetical protein